LFRDPRIKRLVATASARQVRSDQPHAGQRKPHMADPQLELREARSKRRLRALPAVSGGAGGTGNSNSRSTASRRRGTGWNGIRRSLHALRAACKHGSHAKCRRSTVPAVESLTGPLTDTRWLERPPRSNCRPRMAGSAPTEQLQTRAGTAGTAPTEQLQT